MGRNWAEGLFDGGMLPSMDPPEDIQRCLNCTLPPSYCHGLPHCPGEAQPPATSHDRAYTHWTPELLADVIAGRKSQKELARELGITPGAVHRALQRFMGGKPGK